MIDFQNKNHYEWKGHFANYLIEKFRFTSYLELGLGNLDTWNIVECKNKIGVDFDLKFSNFSQDVYVETTDQFFQKNDKKFDLIYIDALHDKHQVRKDFLNSIKFIHDSGIILFHDINPLNVSQTSSQSSGDAFEFWILLSELFELDTIVGPEDDTLGIFRIEKNKKILESVEKISNSDINYSFEFFNENRNELIYKKIISL